MFPALQNVSLLEARQSANGPVRTSTVRAGELPLRCQLGTLLEPIYVPFAPSNFSGEGSRQGLKLSQLPEAFVNWVRELESRLVEQVCEKSEAFFKAKMSPEQVRAGFKSALVEAEQYPTCLRAKVDLEKLRCWDVERKPREAVWPAKVVAALHFARLYFSGSSWGLVVEVPDVVVVDAREGCPIDF